MIYNIEESPKTTKELFLYSFQMMMSCFVATVLIANICGTPVSSCLFSACIATLIYQTWTMHKSPMLISSCGATCSAVISAKALGDGNNYMAVWFGGLVIAIIYTAFSFLIEKQGIDRFNEIFPPTIVGAVTIVIGCNLATFIPTYCSVNGEHNDYAILVAIITMLVTAVSSHYCKGFLKTIPFLMGLCAGYLISIILTVTNICPLIDFSVFSRMKLFTIPDFTLKYALNQSLNMNDAVSVIIMFAPVALCALLEHYSDHKVLSNIIGTDLTMTPGLGKTLRGDGIASLIGTMLCGLPNTSYGESIATIGFSKVASVKVTTVAALMLGALSFIYPVQAFIQSIPSCVMGGLAMILYGYILCSGLKTIMNNNVDLENNKNLIIVSVIITVGVSGIFFLHESFAAVALSMTLGVLLNKILK